MNIVLKIIDLVLRVVRIFFRYSTLCLFRNIKRKIYSLWVSHEFAECGTGCSLDVFDALIGARKMHLGNNVIVGKNSVFELYDQYGDTAFDAHFYIGDNTKIGPYTHITCVNEIRIGKDVLFGRRVLVTDNSHGESMPEQMDMNPDLRPVSSKGPVVIEDCAWIGEGVSIMPGVTIGHGSIIGANAVVTKDIPPYCVAVGNPARIIKKLK